MARIRGHSNRSPRTVIRSTECLALRGCLGNAEQPTTPSVLPDKASLNDSTEERTRYQEEHKCPSELESV